MLFQLIDVAYALLVHTVLKTAPNSVIYCIQVGVVRWPEVRRDEFYNLETVHRLLYICQHFYIVYKC